MKLRELLMTVTELTDIHLLEDASAPEDKDEEPVYYDLGTNIVDFYRESDLLEFFGSREVESINPRIEKNTVTLDVYLKPLNPYLNH